MKFQRFFYSAAALTLLLAVFSISAMAETIYGIRTDSSGANATVLGLVSFDSATPGTVSATIPFTGVVAGQVVRSIDFRPSTGVLYAVSSVTGGTAAQLYTVNPATGVLTPVGAGFTLGAPPNPNGLPAVDLVEIEFNPVVDLIRVLTGANLNAGNNPVPNNYRLDPTTGALVATDVNLNYVLGDCCNGGNATMQIAAAAYANPAAGKTTLYAWDYSNDSFIRIGSIGGTPDSPNSGRMSTILTSIQTTRAGIGMDVGPSGTLYISRDSSADSNSMGLYRVNASTGAQTLIGAYPAGTFITDISTARLTTAAGVTVSGRLLVSGESSDRSAGLANANVVLTDASGTARTAISGRGGAFAFDDVEVGRTYTLSVRSKGYAFDPQVITVLDSVSNVSLNGSLMGRDR